VDAGLVNRLLMNLGFIDKGINFLLSGDHIWIKMTAWGIWKGLGWGAIMYLAALAGIDQELYEAARVDGAGRFRQIWHITIPGLLPTYFVLLLLSIANLINNGMDQYFVFKNAMNIDTIEVLDLYVYNLGFGGNSTSGIPFATAISMLKSVISLTLLFFSNTMSKVLRGESIF
jgi:putative aldouronate transport system permease protein